MTGVIPTAPSASAMPLDIGFFLKVLVFKVCALFIFKKNDLPVCV
jgi:hypothetical protein